MQFIVLLILFKIALTVLFFTVGALLIAEFFPILADKAVSASSGTMFAFVGDVVSQALLFIAKYAQMFVEFVLGWLSVFGIEIDYGAVKDGVKDVNLDAAKNPDF